MDARTSAIFPLSIIFPLSVIIFPLFEYAELNGGVHFIRFRLEITFLDKIDPKSQNCQFKLKCEFKTNSNMQNSIALFTFNFLDRKNPFWANWV